jgi:hypothetical protein
MVAGSGLGLSGARFPSRSILSGQDRALSKVCFGPVSGRRSYPARYFDRYYAVPRSRLG